ncbi:MAG: Maf family protein, partial [Ruminococcus sp.]|nr:Maf family protein [Ruminococcus sp.]
MKKIVLASASPRRRELINYISDDVLCVPSGEDETLPDGISASETAQFLALQKAKSVAKNYPDSVVIGCDTVVILD